jgi:hypothetical protein
VHRWRWWQSRGCAGGRLASAVASRVEVKDWEDLEGFIVDDIEEVGGRGWRGGEVMGAPSQPWVAGRRQAELAQRKMPSTEKLTTEDKDGRGA